MHLTLKSYIEQVEKWQLSPAEVVSHYISKAKKNNPDYNAFISFTDDYINQNLSSFSELPLHAAPIWVKDIILSQDQITTCGSKILENFKPPYSSTAFKNLEKAWWLTIWKTNMDEFAMWWSTESSYFGPATNIYWKNRVPWWSSGWSAIAVAWDFAIAALGTDTWWSIRQPAAFTNIVWIKPTYGRVSRFWVQSMASSLDQVWVFAKTVEDARLLLWVVSWFDPQDSQSDKKADDKNFLKSSDAQTIKNYKIAVPKQVFSEWLDPRIEERFQIMIEKLKSEWYFVSEVDLPVLSYSVPLYYTLMPAEVSTNLSRFDWIKFWLQDKTSGYDDIFKYYEKVRSEWLWDEVKRRILLWTFVLSSANYEWYYLRAQKARQKLKSDFNKVFSEYDLILLPTTPDIPRKIWERIDDPVKMYLSDMFTIPANIAGLPAISVPMWMVKDWDEELPTWIQIMWNRRNENKILDLAEVIEKLQK